MKEDKILKIYCDGGARGNPGPAAAAFLVFENNKVIYRKAIFLGKRTNNFSEHTAVYLAFNWLLKNYHPGVISKIIFYIDSELVVNQLRGVYKTNNKILKTLVLKTKEIEKVFGYKVYYN